MSWDAWRVALTPRTTRRKRGIGAVGIALRRHHELTTMKTLPLPLLVSGWVLLAAIAAGQGTPEIKPALVHGFSANISDFHNGIIVGPGSFKYGTSEHGGRFGFGTFFEVNPSGEITRRASFGETGSDARGRNPVGQLVYDGSTYFYGVTAKGGRFGCGTIFRTTAAGAVETLVDLSGRDGAAPGFEPTAGLALGADGNFYGLLDSGPADRGPGLFRVSANGRYQFLLEFPASDEENSFGVDPLFARGNNTFLGVLRNGGRDGNGLVFRLNADDTVDTLATFTGGNPGVGGAIPGANPMGAPVQALDGTIYGIGQSFNGAQQGNAGFVWKIDTSGVAGIVTTFDFGSGPANPRPPIALDTNGDLLVSCASGGSNGRGGLFRITPGGAVSVVSNYDGTSGEAVAGFVQFGLMRESAFSYLTATDDEIVRVPIPGTVDVFVLSSPDAGTNQGASPNSPVVFTPSGTLDVLTRSGGANRRGTVVAKPSSGPAALLAPMPADYFAFHEQFLTLDSANNVLVVDRFGGANGRGRILQITPAGAVSTRVNFTDGSDANNVFNPSEGLAFDGSATFFGLGSSFTNGGDGPNALAAYRFSGAGPLVPTRINPSASEPTRIGGSFDSFSGPLVPLEAAPNIQHFLGVLETDSGAGKIFRLGMGGRVVTFHNFSNSPSASRDPVGPLLREPLGTFLVPAASASSDDVVNIVRLTPQGETGRAAKIGNVSFRHAAEQILAPLARDAQGRIYGVLEEGGASGSGVLYRVETDGTTRILFEFPVDTASDNAGATPSAGLTFNPLDGAIYGVAGAGGPNGGGTIFKVFPTPQATALVGESPIALNAHDATLSGSITNNGFNVEYWFAFGTDQKNPDQETAPAFAGGFHGTAPFTQTITGLKGHTTYYFDFIAKVGFGADAVTISGGQLILTTPNGAPVALNDTILVTTSNPGDQFVGEVIDNDTDLDDDIISIQSFTQPASGYGTVTQDGNRLIYTPTQAFFDNGGRDSFTYTITDNFAGAGGPLTATATVDVLFQDTIKGAYAGLLFEDPDASAIPREIALIPSPDEIAAGFAQIALASGRRFSGRFQVGARNFPVRGIMNTERGTRVRSGDRFSANLRTTPAGLEARITIDGRTLIMRAGQAFAAVSGPAPKSDFTMRFSPTENSDPVNGSGLPAGSGFAVVRQGATARATIVGALPDGTPFSAKSVIDPDGKMPFRALLAKGKAGTFDGELMVDVDAGTIEAAPGTSARWEKNAQAKSKRFPSGFGTKMTPFGGKHTVATPVLDLTGGELVATFDRGGLFAPLVSEFTFNGARAVVDSTSDTARATAVFNSRTGLVKGTFKPAGKPVKYRGVTIQRDSKVAGFFLGTADAGSVEMMVIP